jgi:hypothetical protein
MDLVETGRDIVGWIDLAQDRDNREGLVNDSVNLQFHKLVGNY